MVNWMVDPWMVHLWKISFILFCRYVVWSFRCVCIKRVLWTTTQFYTKVTRISEGKTSSIHFLSFINLMFCWWLFKWDCYFSVRYLIVFIQIFFSLKDSHLLIFLVIQMCVIVFFWYLFIKHKINLNLIMI